MPEQTTATGFVPHPTGMFACYGYPVPQDRIGRAYEQLRLFIPDVTDDEATALIDHMASAIERDKPYEMERIMLLPRDEATANSATIYWLWAVLMSHPPGTRSEFVPGPGPRKDLDWSASPSRPSADSPT